MTLTKKPAKIKAEKSTLNQEGTGYKIFYVFNILLLCAVVVATAYPIWFVIIASVSDPLTMMQNHGTLMVVPFFPLSFRAYELVLSHPLLLSGYRNTLTIVGVGLTINMILTCFGAYFMALRNCVLRKPITIIIIFTMYFNAGIVPTYLNVQSLGLLDTLWSVILMGAISTFNMLILRSAFLGVPESLS